MSPVSCVIYYGSLLSCVSLGSFYRNLGSANMKRDFGTGLGILLTVLICGQYIYHSLLMVWVNIVIIKCCNRSYMHQISLAYTWIYLLYLHLNVKNIYVTWLLQMQALKLVGLAFEINSNTIYKENLMKISVEESSSVSVQPSSAEIVAYLYCFIGLHKGPYFRWKTYADHFDEQFTVSEDLWPVTELQLKKAFFYTIAYSILRAGYSTDLYKNPSFYQNYGADFRFLYNIPLSIMHLLRYEAMVLVSTSVCTETGFGVYSNKNPSSGTGTDDSDVAEEKFDFSSMQCFNNRKLVFGPTMKDTISSWDIPTRGWFLTHIYQGLLKSRKETRHYTDQTRGSILMNHTSNESGQTISCGVSLNRSVISFMAWTVWRGPTISNAISASTFWVYIQLETEYLRLFNTTGSIKLPWDIGFSIMRLFCLLYLTPCFVLNDTATVFKYYNSIFWVYHIILIVLMIIAVLANKFKKI